MAETKKALVERLFTQHGAAMPIFNEYKEKTSRQIPVFVLERID